MLSTSKYGTGNGVTEALRDGDHECDEHSVGNAVRVSELFDACNRFGLYAVPFRGLRARRDTEGNFAFDHFAGVMRQVINSRFVDISILPIDSTYSIIDLK